MSEYEWSNRVKKNTGMLSYLGTDAVLTNSKNIDGVSLAWFKEIRQYAGAKCNAFINREAADVKPDNLLVKSNNLPTEADLNDLPLKVLRLDGIDSSVHEIAKLYTPAFKEIADKSGIAPGSTEFLDSLKASYRLYCIAVLTDPLVIFY